MVDRNASYGGMALPLTGQCCHSRNSRRCGFVSILYPFGQWGWCLVQVGGRTLAFFDSSCHHNEGSCSEGLMTHQMSRYVGRLEFIVLCFVRTGMSGRYGFVFLREKWRTWAREVWSRSNWLSVAPSPLPPCCMLQGSLKLLRWIPAYHLSNRHHFTCLTLSFQFRFFKILIMHNSLILSALLLTLTVIGHLGDNANASPLTKRCQWCPLNTLQMKRLTHDRNRMPLLILCWQVHVRLLLLFEPPTSPSLPFSSIEFLIAWCRGNTYCASAIMIISRDWANYQLRCYHAFELFFKFATTRQLESFYPLTALSLSLIEIMLTVPTTQTVLIVQTMQSVVGVQ